MVRRGSLARRVSLLLLALTSDRVRFGIAQGCAIEICLAVLNRDGTGFNIGTAYRIQRVASGNIQNVFQRYFDRQPIFMIGVKVELPGGTKVGRSNGASVDIDAGLVGDIVGRRMGRDNA